MLDKLIDILLFIPRVLFSAFIDMIIFIFNAIPVPAFLQDLNFSGFRYIGYFADVFQLDFAFTIILSALLARFAINRMPFIGK